MSLFHHKFLKVTNTTEISVGIFAGLPAALDTLDQSLLIIYVYNNGK